MAFFGINEKPDKNTPGYTSSSDESSDFPACHSDFRLKFSPKSWWFLPRCLEPGKTLGRSSFWRGDPMNWAFLTLNSLKVLDITEYRVCRYSRLEYNSYTHTHNLIYYSWFEYPIASLNVYVYPLILLNICPEIYDHQLGGLTKPLRSQSVFTIYSFVWRKPNQQTFSMKSIVSAPEIRLPNHQPNGPNGP